MMLTNTGYPKDFKKERMIIDRKKCFFIMPFNEKGNATYAHLSQALRDKGFFPVRVDMNPESSFIMHKIMKEIVTSNYIIVDISGNNPNVFYELGIAHTFKESPNVIIIKDKETNAPSDIRHINYIEYNHDNYLLLAENVIHSLDALSYITELSYALSINGLLDDSMDYDFILQTIESGFSQMEISIITKTLNEDYEGIKDSDSTVIIKKSEGLLKEITAINYDEAKKDFFFAFYTNILVKSCSNNIVSDRLKKLYSGEKILLDNELDLSLKTDVALKFLDLNKKIDIVMPWIIEYFSRSKSTHIDLNRYKIEAFLTNTKDNRFDEYIIQALGDNDRHIREHMADIIGEKKISRAINKLREQLSIENNIYSAASLMEAIGKIGSSEDIDIINDWISKNLNRVNNPGGNFVFKHAYNAITSLTDDEKASEFIDKYGEYFRH